MVRLFLLGLGVSLLNVSPVFGECITATYYDDWYEGRRMANGQRFSQYSNNAASNSYPIGTRLSVTRGRYSTTVIIKDRIGYGTDLNLSKSSFQQLASLSKGRIKVCVKRK